MSFLLTVALANHSFADFYHTSQRHFRVPFQINPNGRALIEIQVFKSNDQGRSWQLLSKLNPNAKEFVYKTNRDEQVWFCVKSMDRDKRIYPAGPAKPDVKIVIDTQRPQLSIGVQADAAGRIVTSIQSSDQHINPNSLKIEYQSGRDGQWIDAKVKSTKRANSSVFQDQIAWWPQGTAGQMLVKVSIADFAGNRAESTQRVAVTGTAQRNQQLLQQKQQNHSSNNGSPNSPSVQPHQFKTISSGHLVETPDQYSTPLQSTVQRSQQNSTGQSSVPWASETVPVNSSLVTSTTNRPPPPPGQKTTPDGNMVVAVGSTHSKTDSTSSQKIAASSASKTIRPASSKSLANLMELARPTNTQKFLLTYDVDAIAQQNIREVGLWMTTNGGQSWRKWAIDNDHQSPFSVEVPQEGIYGFRIVVSSTEGLNSRVPRAGDPADMWVRYDATRPTAKITSAPYGRGRDAGKLVINWKAADEQLRLRPVTLSYSSRPEGPWTTIATDLRNTGRYVWKVPQSVPDQVYLQLKVIDTAGNVALDQPGQPINVANLVPSGRINGLQPLRPSHSQPPKPFNGNQAKTNLEKKRH